MKHNKLFDFINSNEYKSIKQKYHEANNEKQKIIDFIKRELFKEGCDPFGLLEDMAGMKIFVLVQ